MTHKTWLIAFGVISALLLGGAGFYAFSSYSAYADSMATWDSKVGTIESLERRVPYPNKENRDALETKVASYRTAVNELFEGLNSFQRPLNKELLNTEFLQVVKEKVQAFRSFAATGGMAIENSIEFQLGFDAYSGSIPDPDLVAILDYELEAIDYLLRNLVTSGVESMVSFDRDLIPGEEGTEKVQESGVVHKYPIRLKFTASHDSFQRFINTLANDRNFFYIVRVLKVTNQVTAGPPKLAANANASSTPVFINSLTQEEASFELLQSWGYPTAPASEVESNARSAGYVTSNQDARVLMGNEKLDVFMVVDIVRFLSPEEVSAAETKSADNDRRKR